MAVAEPWVTRPSRQCAVMKRLNTACTSPLLPTSAHTTKVARTDGLKTKIAAMGRFFVEPTVRNLLRFVNVFQTLYNAEMTNQKKRR